LDLAAVDAALLVEALEIGVDGPGDRGIGRCRTAIGVGVADLDLGIAGTVVVFLLGPRQRRAEKHCGRRHTPHETTSCRIHGNTSLLSCCRQVSPGTGSKRRPPAAAFLSTMSQATGVSLLPPT